MSNNQYLQESIIESISNIDTVIMESEYNVLNSILDDYHKSMLIYENYQGDDILEFPIFQESYIQEGFGDVVKKGIAKGKAIAIKIWNAIKALLRFIGKQIQRVINFVKNLFRRNKHPKSADQILDELNVKPSHVQESAIVYTKASTSSSHHIPSNPKSSTDPPDVKAIHKSLMVRFNKDGSFQLKGTDVVKLYKSKRGEGDPVKEKFKSQENTPIGYAQLVATILNNDEYMEQLNEACNEISKYFSGQKDIDNTKISDVASLFTAKSAIANTFKFTDEIEKSNFTVDQLSKFQKRIASMISTMSQINNPDFGSDDDKEVINMLSGFEQIFETLQFGLNTITGALQNSFVVDEVYSECVKDINIIAQFTDECILSGIPSKYVGYNVWYISHKAIRGEGNEKEFAPLWGQTRIVFLPKNVDFIFKIALNEAGKMANMQERRVSYKVKNDEMLSKHLVPALKLSKNHTVMSMEKVDTSVECTAKEADDLRIKINDRLKEIKATFRIEDIYNNNVTKVPSGEVVCFDYGLIGRA